MNYEFDRDLLSEDWNHIKDFFGKFFKSFGPSEKKVKGVPIGFWEGMYIKFRLMLVEMGISQVIRLCLAFIVGVVVYFAIYRQVGPGFKVVTVFLFICYFIWLYAPHLAKDGKIKDGKIEGKPEGTVSGLLISFHNNRVEAQGSLMEYIGGFFKSLFSSK
jgi:hypothetical protein